MGEGMLRSLGKSTWWVVYNVACQDSDTIPHRFHTRVWSGT